MGPRQYLLTRHDVNDGVIRLSLTGDFDLVAGDDLRAAIIEAVEIFHAAELYIDLAEVTFFHTDVTQAIIDGRSTAAAADCEYHILDPRRWIP